MPQEAPGKPQDAPGGPRRPQEVSGSPRRPQEAPGGPASPSRPQEAQEAPGGPRRPQEATGGHRRPQEIPGNPRRPQEAPRRPPGRPRRPPQSPQVAPTRLLSQPRAVPADPTSPQGLTQTILVSIWTAIEGHFLTPGNPAPTTSIWPKLVSNGPRCFQRYFNQSLFKKVKHDWYMALALQPCSNRTQKKSPPTPWIAKNSENINLQTALVSGSRRVSENRPKSLNSTGIWTQPFQTRKRLLASTTEKKTPNSTGIWIKTTSPGPPKKS